MRVLSLCSGIGGFELGAKLVNQRLGKEVFQLKALCEKNQFCRDRALKPNFPGIPIYEDIRDIPAISGTYDLIVGGLPCQPFSLAGKQKGESDDRNLFPEFFRLLRGIRPAGAIIENVPGLLTANSGQFFRDILWQFTEAGYSVAWDVVSCAEVGGVHRRERLWIIAYSNDDGRHSGCEESETSRGDGEGGRSQCLESARSSRVCDASIRLPKMEAGDGFISNECLLSNASNANSLQRLQWQRLSEGQERECLPNTIRCGGSSINADSNGKGLEARQRQPSEQTTIREPERSRGCDDRQNEAQPGICSLNDGISDRLVRSHLMTPEELPDRLPYATDSDDIPYRKEILQALGNAIVPDVAAIALYKFLEIIGCYAAIDGPELPPPSESRSVHLLLCFATFNCFGNLFASHASCLGNFVQCG